MPDSEYSDALPLDAVLQSGDEANTEDGGFNNVAIKLLEDFRDYLRPTRSTCPKPSPPFIFDHGWYRVLQFDHFHLQSEMDMRDPYRLTIDYTRMMMGFLFFVPEPKRIEMIGLGGGSLAKYCHNMLPDADITVVEISPQVIGLRDRFLIPPDTDRFRVVQADGADFVRCDTGRPDVILVDGFDASGQPPQLCSPEFYGDCYQRLAPGAMMVVNLWGSYQDRSGYVARIRDAFGDRTLEVPTEGGTNQAVFAAKGMKPTLSRAGLVGRDFDNRRAPWTVPRDRRTPDHSTCGEASAPRVAFRGISPGLGEGPHQRQPSDRDHHRATASLEDAAGHEQMDIARQPAKAGSEREDPDRGREHAPRPAAWIRM
jgi:spermidine synthase